MKKIEKLTTAQEREMIEFREQYRGYGLSCEPADRKRAEDAITQMYTLINKKQPVYFWFDGIIISQMAVQIFSNLWKNLGANLGANLEANLWANLGANLEANLGANLGDNLWANLEANPRVNLGDNLRDNLRANLGVNLDVNLEDNLGVNLWKNLWANLRDNLEDNLWANLRANPRANLGNNFTNLWGQMDAYWIAYYKYPHEKLRKMHNDRDMEKLNLWDELCQSCSWWWAYENICIIADRPLEIHMSNMRLHNEAGPAFIGRDGWKLWYLNGVQVTQELVETPASKLDAKMILKEQNAEVRREIVRKIGVELAIQRLGAKVIDKQGDYELLDFDLGEDNFRPYLKMLNPSIGTWHVEGVSPNCRTVEQALNWRNGTNEKPIVLT